MGKKTAGKLNPPPAQAVFDDIALGNFCCKVTGIFYRLHPINPATGDPWPPIHFSRRGNTRFDPMGGLGALCLAETLAGGLMELFDDHWGPVGSIGRSVTEKTLAETWVSLVSVHEARLFDATAGNLSKIGTDAQLLTGDYATTREWALRMMQHPDQIDGIYYRSRHDLTRLNGALFGQNKFLPAGLDPNLTPDGIAVWIREPAHGTTLFHGPAVRLRDHPLLHQSIVELQVARLP